MKKLSLILVFVLLFVLTSCEVHLGDAAFEVPWWVIAIPIVLVCLIAHLIIIHKKYRCPFCGNELRPRWYEISSWLHMGSARAMKCSHCGKKGLFPPAD